MLVVKLNEQDLNNLKVFLDRVELKGKEVLPFINIIKALNEAEEEKPEKVGD